MLYHLLNQDAKSRVRSRTGGVDRWLERGFIRENVDVLRRALKDHGYCVVGRGNWGIYAPYYELGDHTGGMESPMVQVAIAVGILVINITTVPDTVLPYKMLSLSLSGLTPERLDIIVPRWEKLGATVYNWPQTLF